MKRILHIVLCALSFMLIFGSCAPNPQPDESVTSEADDTGNVSESVPSGTNADAIILLSAQGETDYTLIKSNDTSVEYADTVQAFIDALKEKTGVDMKKCLYGEAVSETSKEIIIGNVRNRDASVKSMEETGYSEANITVNGDKIVISGYSNSLLKKALLELVEALEKNENGEWMLNRTYSYTKEASAVKNEVPRYETAKGELLGIYSCGEGNYSATIGGTDLSEYTEYIRSLGESGFELYKENEIGENLFGTYLSSDKKSVAYTMFYPNTETVKIVWGGNNTYLPSTEKIAYPTEEEAKAVPSITQIGRDGVWSGYNASTGIVGGAPGMSYVIQLADGRFIIIDGGNADSNMITLTEENGQWTENEAKMTNDTEALFNFLKAKSEGITEKPVIAAWIITHAHGDHMGLVNNFLSTYKNEVIVEIAAYNFPDFNNSVSLTDGTTLSSARLVSSFKGALYALPAKHQPKRFVFHTGQQLYFAGCEIEFLYTHEDYFPNDFATGNHTSSVFRIKLENENGAETTFMVLGDAEMPLCADIATIYGSELKSDICQLSHHGFNGATLELYQYIDPDICFWACDSKRFCEDKRCLGTRTGYEFNAWIRDESIKVREHYCSDVTTTVTLD